MERLRCQSSSICACAAFEIENISVWHKYGYNCPFLGMHAIRGLCNRYQALEASYLSALHKLLLDTSIVL